MLAGLIFIRLRQPALIGFILVGAILGHSGLGIIDSTENLRVLAELGVTLLMFVIGMELSLRSFRRTYRVSIIVAITQLIVALLVAALIGYFAEWSFPRIIAIGFAFALSSTAVGLRVLEDTGELRTHAGQIAVGVLIAQDLLTAPMLITINGLASGQSPALNILGKLILTMAILITLIVFLSKREKFRMPFSEWVTDNSGTVALAALTLCFCLGAMAELIGLAVPFGAFLAGLILGNSVDRQKYLHAVMPIQEVLMMLFFLSIGLLIDVEYILKHLPTILMSVVVLMITKSLVTYFIFRLTGTHKGDAAVASAALGSMGEFSFVIGAAALSSAFILPETSKLLVSVIFLSLLVTPLWLSIARKYSVTWQRHQLEI